jgi:hypothetical protein
MIHIKDLTVKNFMSVGNSTQGIDFDRNDLTLVLGNGLIWKIWNNNAC